MAKRKSKGISGFRKILYAFIGVAIISLCVLGYDFYKIFEAPNVSIPGNEKDSFIYIPTGTTFPGLVRLLVNEGTIRNEETFQWLGQKTGLAENVRPGRYAIYKGMNNWELVRLLKSGRQTPVKFVLNKIRTRDQFVTFVSSHLEVDSTTFRISLNDPAYLRQFGFTPTTVMAMFVPNTYEFYWNINADKFMAKMKEEYAKFWNTARVEKAKEKGLTPVEATTLASIVEEETNANSEKGTIASVYLNRLNKGMLLQADPTVKFAVNNFALRRVTSTQTNFDSPYNTYKYKGLPPGPICTPSLSSINAVLNGPETDYIYFCADCDKIGYHVFAKNYLEHEKNALRYWNYLNGRGIK